MKSRNTTELVSSRLAAQQALLSSPKPTSSELDALTQDFNSLATHFTTSRHIKVKEILANPTFIWLCQNYQHHDPAYSHFLFDIALGHKTAQLIKAFHDANGMIPFIIQHLQPDSAKSMLNKLFMCLSNSKCRGSVPQAIKHLIRYWDQYQEFNGKELIKTIRSKVQRINGSKFTHDYILARLEGSRRKLNSTKTTNKIPFGAISTNAATPALATVVTPIAAAVIASVASSEERLDNLDESPVGTEFITTPSSLPCLLEINLPSLTPDPIETSLTATPPGLLGVSIFSGRICSNVYSNDPNLSDPMLDFSDIPPGPDFF